MPTDNEKLNQEQSNGSVKSTLDNDTGFDPFNEIFDTSVDDNWDNDLFVANKINTEYQQELQHNIDNDKRVYDVYIKEKMDEARKLLIQGEINEATKVAYELGANVKAFQDSFYKFENELRNAFYDGVEERKKITLEQEKNKIISAYTLKNDRANNSLQINAYRTITDKYSNNEDFEKFALRLLAINSITKHTEDPSLKKAYYLQIGDNSFNNVINNEFRMNMINDINDVIERNIVNQGLPVNAETRKEQIAVLLSIDLDTNKKMQNMELAYNSIYLKELQKPEQTLQEQKIEELRKSLPEATIIAYQPYDLRGIANQVEDQGFKYGDLDFTYADKTVNKVKDLEVYFVKPTIEIERINYQNEVKATFEAFEDNDSLDLLNDPTKLNYKSVDDMQQINTKDGKVLNLYFQPRQVHGASRIVYYEDANNPVTNYQPEPIVAPEAPKEAVAQVNTKTDTPLPVESKEFDVDLLSNSTEYLKRQMVLTEFLKLSNNQHLSDIKAINKKHITHFEKQYEIKDAKDINFSIENNLLTSYLNDKKEMELLEKKKEKSKNDEYRIQELSFWLEGGMQQYVSQKYLLDDKVFSQIQEKFPNILTDIEKRIENAKDPKITDPKQQEIDAVINAFSKQHKIKNTALKRIFKEATSKEALNVAGKILKGTSLAFNPAGFLVGQGVKKMLMSKPFKQFRLDFADRLSTAFEHFGVKKGSKIAQVAKITGAMIIGGGIATYVLMSGDFSIESINKLKDLYTENSPMIKAAIVDTYQDMIDTFTPDEQRLAYKEIHSLDLKHGSFSEGLEKFMSLGQQEHSTFLQNNLTDVEKLDLQDLSLSEELELALKTDPASPQFDSDIQQKYNKIMHPEDFSQATEMPILETAIVYAPMDNDLLVSNIMNKEFPIEKLKEGIELAQQKGISIDLDTTLKSIEDKLHSQLQNGTFPREIKIDFTQVEGDFSISKEQLLTQHNILNTPIYTVVRGDTLSEIAETMAKQQFGDAVTNDQIWELTDKIKVLNNLDDYNVIQSGQDIKIPNFDALEQYAVTDPNPVVNSFSDFKTGSERLVLLPNTNINLMAEELSNAAVKDGTIAFQDKLEMKGMLLEHMKNTQLYHDVNIDTETNSMIAEINTNRNNIIDQEQTKLLANQQGNVAPKLKNS